MKRKFEQLSLIFIFTILTLVEAKQYQIENGVINITDDIFNQTLASHKDTIIMFYAPWCDISRNLLSEFERAARTLRDLSSKVKLGKVNCEYYIDTCQKYKVRNYPTIMYFSDDVEKSYA